MPDPFEKYNSFGEHNNEMLKKFLNDFNFNYTFKSSTQLYKSGFFNESLKINFKQISKIMNIIIPTLGTEKTKNLFTIFTNMSKYRCCFRNTYFKIDEK